MYKVSRSHNRRILVPLFLPLRQDSRAGVDVPYVCADQDSVVSAEEDA